MKDENAIEQQAEDRAISAQSAETELGLIISAPRRKYTSQEIKEARGNLALMNDRVFFGTFDGNKNNRIITGIVNALRKIHALGDIAPIERTELQKMSIEDVLERGMVGDLFGFGRRLNITVEVQRGKQAGYAVRGTITSSSATRVQFEVGSEFAEAPDVIGINILDFELPELENRKLFCSRIVRAEYESKETFLAGKYSEYYIELPKMKGIRKEDLPKEYHDLWDLCCIFKAKVKEHKEVIRMQKIRNHAALELSREVKKTVAPRRIVEESISISEELERYKRNHAYKLQQKLKEAEQKAEVAEQKAEVAEQKAEVAEQKAEEAEQKAEEAEQKAEEAEQKAKEEMLIAVLQSCVPQEAVEAIRLRAGITEARLAELKEQARIE